jgi:hypothetical protein
MKAKNITERDNFFWLLIALVFLLFSDALISQFESAYGRLLVNISLLITLFVAVWALDRNRHGPVLRYVKIGITVIVAGFMVGDFLVDSPLMALGQQVACLIFLCLSLYLVWKQVLFTGYVDTNKIIGSVCIYILLGQDSWRGNLEEFIYYSMVTLTTLGYGDIAPQQPLARFLAYSEAVAGVFYTTILVASLVGVRLAHGPEKPAPGQESPDPA